MFTACKMHGDKTRVAEAILAKDDNETYHPKRELFSIALRWDLTQKTLFIVGLGFTDPNLACILNRGRRRLLVCNSQNAAVKDEVLELAHGLDQLVAAAECYQHAV